MVISSLIQDDINIDVIGLSGTAKNTVTFKKPLVSFLPRYIWIDIIPSFQNKE